MAHMTHPQFRRRLKAVLLACGFALFMVMAVLAAHQASNPKLSHGRHTVATPHVPGGAPAAAPDNETVAHSLPSASVDTAPPPASPSPPPVNAPAVPATPTDNSQPAALSQALALSASLRAVMNQSQPAAAANPQ